MADPKHPASDLDLLLALVDLKFGSAQTCLLITMTCPIVADHLPVSKTGASKTPKPSIPPRSWPQQVSELSNISCRQCMLIPAPQADPEKTNIKHLAVALCSLPSTWLLSHLSDDDWKFGATLSLRTLAPSTQASPHSPNIRSLRVRTLSGGLGWPPIKLHAGATTQRPLNSQMPSPTLCCLPPKKHLFLTWKENDSRATKQYNICACINQNLDSLPDAPIGSLMQRCPAMVVLPHGGSVPKDTQRRPSLLAPTCLISTWENSRKGYAKLGLSYRGEFR